MASNLICARCKTTIRVRDDVAGEGVICPHCHAKVVAPARAATFAMGNVNERRERVLGKRPPLILDILGVHTQWGGGGAEFATRDVVKLVWSLRHVALLLLLLVFFVVYGESRESAMSGAPLFFWLGAILLVVAWVQVNRIAKGLTENLAVRRSKGMLARVLAATLLVVTDFRASLPALRTFFWALCLILAGLHLAATAGAYGNIVPMDWLRMERAPAVTPYRDLEAERREKERLAKVAKEEQDARDQVTAASEAATRAAAEAEAKRRQEEAAPLPAPLDEDEHGK
ncbi:MAG: hypothetical protein FWD61_16265 [Phycisphaerales bacterium]|nr:hypothetical protein [Phycisphaerales bacterium]